MRQPHALTASADITFDISAPTADPSMMPMMEPTAIQLPSRPRRRASACSTA
jgi:hypothetical protein